MVEDLTITIVAALCVRGIRCSFYQISGADNSITKVKRAKLLAFYRPDHLERISEALNHYKLLVVQLERSTGHAIRKLKPQPECLKTTIMLA
jgi:hypothetical protein